MIGDTSATKNLPLSGLIVLDLTLARAGPSEPPINSTKRSMFSLAASLNGSAKKVAPARSMSRLRFGSRAETPVTTI